MMTVYQKELLIELVIQKQETNPPNKRVYDGILADLLEDLRRHELAIKKSNDRNKQKGSRRDQRGPTI